MLDPNYFERLAKRSEERTSWTEITIHSDMSPAAKQQAMRLNALGSMYYFSKVVLGYTRLVGHLHGKMCRELENDRIQIVMEIPRDHFKSTVASVTAPMWWALPFTELDEYLMRSMGYGDEWIRWMQRAHCTSTRTLVASEVIGNARKLGSKISDHYKSNAAFRTLFPEIIPSQYIRWNQDSMTHVRMDGVHHGEGTYDFIGVKGALQSRHYDRVIEDDLVGEKAKDSDIVMETTLEWHRKLPGAFDSDPKDPSRLADQLIIGNRWSHRDLNSWVRKHESRFRFITHDAEGDCGKECTWGHRAGVPIFPEEFTMDKLGQIRATEGGYNYSCQYRNRPVAPEAVRFKSSWLRYYTQVAWDGKVLTPDNTVNWQQLTPQTRQTDLDEQAGAVPVRIKMAMRHETQAGETVEDIRAADLDRICIADPNHGEERGRSRNAAIVFGIYNRPGQPRRIYLLDCWAKSCSHTEWADAILSTQPGQRGLAVKWRCHHVYVESEVSGQQGWKHYFKERLMRMYSESPNDATFTIRPLKTDRSANGKEKRIIGMEAIYENGFFWVRRRGQELWMQEYEEYPNSETNDLLDITGYLPQCWGGGSRANTREFLQEELQKRQRVLSSVGQAGY